MKLAQTCWKFNKDQQGIQQQSGLDSQNDGLKMT